MKQLRKIVTAVLISVMVLAAFTVPAQAKTVKAKTYSLKDVRKAVKPRGMWVKKSGGMRFRLNSTGKSVKSRWINVDGKFYYVDSRGNRAQNCWVRYRSNMYRMNKSGQMITGWMKLGSRIYYLRSDGIRVKGIRTIRGQKYFFDKYGVRKTGWQTSGRDQYYFDKKTAKMRTSCWVKNGSRYHFVGSDGKKRKSCWIISGRKKYYLNEDGVRVTGIVYIGNKGYYFRKDGVYDPNVKVKSEVDVSKPMVALTFDDGPGAYTNRLLNSLQANNAKATFFMVGTNVPRYKNTVKRMANMGCELGNHSYSHSRFTWLSAAGIRSELAKTAGNIRSAAGKSPTLVRLPYGEGHSSSSVLNALGLPSVYWSIDTRDWANTGNPQSTINAVLNHVKSGDIILMHDIHLSTVQAAETIIPALKKRGYQMVTVSQLAKYKGRTTMRAGKTYYHFK